jgi:hypothetical protein
MRTLRPIICTAALALAAAGTALALAAPPAGAALNWPPQQILIYNGVSNKPFGPPGPLPGSEAWVPWTAQEKITVAGLGTFVEDNTTLPSGEPNVWYFNSTGAVLHGASLEPGKKEQRIPITLLATTGDNSDWIPLTLKGGETGVYAPGCLVYSTAAGTQGYAVFDPATLKWSAADTCPPVLPAG